MTADELASSYLSLLKLALMGMAGGDAHSFVRRPDGTLAMEPADPQQRRAGADWPVEGLTMIGQRRLDSLQWCVEQVLADEVPGDLIEAGVWRGGASMFMRALLGLHDSDRTIYAADSFEGFPEPDPERFEADVPRATRRHPGALEYLAVPLEQVQENFRRYGLLDERVRFVKGWFRDTLPELRDHTWALMRLDGDFYESTIVALESLYPSLSPGGFCIVDDYALPACASAVEDYRAANGITTPLEAIDFSGRYWRKPRGASAAGRATKTIRT